MQQSSLLTEITKLARGQLRVRHLVAVASVAMAAGFLVRGWVADAPEPDVQTVALKDVVRSVKQQLAQADLEGRRAGEAPLFQLKDFTFEANTVVGSSRGSELKVLSVGSSASINQEKVQKITIRWEVPTSITDSQSVPPTANIAAKPDVVVQ